MIKEKNRWTAIYNLCWYGVLILVMLFSAFRSNINLFERIDFIPLEWFAASERQPLFNAITFWVLAMLLTIRVIVHIVLKSSEEQADAISFEEMKDRFEQCRQDIKESNTKAEELKLMLNDISHIAENQYEKTNMLLENAKTQTRGAWKTLLAEYCATTPKLRRTIEKTVKGFKQTLDHLEGKD